MRVFITGMTGTLGTALAKYHYDRGDSIWGCARNESRAVEWLSQYGRTATLFVAGAERLTYSFTDMGRILPSIDRVYHCAAMKHVDLCEKSPTEALGANVDLTTHVARVAKERMVFISSDKACLPTGVYGATKLLAEKLALREGAAVVRLGNLVGSSGSVFSFWKQAVGRGEKIKVTGRSMTRFFIGIEEAAKFVAEEGVPGRVVVPSPLKAAVMGEVADAISRDSVEVGYRPGEVEHQWIVAPGEEVSVAPGKLVLGSGGVRNCGACSLNAPKWNTRSLLELAGIPL